jgi:hypothetical protein
MTTSRRRTFTAGPKGPIITETVQLSQSARDRAIAAQVSNLEQTNARQQRNATAAQGQAIYRGGGEFSTLGGDGGSRRTNITSGGVPIGAVVPNAGGLVGGMPAPGDGDAQSLKLLGERVAAVAFERGPIAGNGDPNALEIAPRYPQDQYWAADTRSLWQWRATVGEELGEWEIIATGLSEQSIGVPSPVANNVYGIIPNAEGDYIPVSLTVKNRSETGGSATNGTGTLLVNGTAATLGVTAIAPGDFVGVRVDTVGTGVFYATVVVRGG